MKTTQGTCVDILNASTNQRPLHIDLTNGLTLMRLNHGAFKLRIHTAHITEVKLSIDGGEVLCRRVNPGIHVFDADNNGAPFLFVPSADAGAAIMSAQAVPAVDPVLDELSLLLEEDETLTEDGRNRLAQPFRGFGGRLNVGLVYFHDDSGTQHEFESERVALQLNTHDDHLRAIAENFAFYKATKDPSAGATPALCGCCMKTQ